MKVRQNTVSRSGGFRTSAKLVGKSPSILRTFITRYTFAVALRFQYSKHSEQFERIFLSSFLPLPSRAYVFLAT